VNVVERATVLHFLLRRIATRGAEAVQALGWRGEDSQRARFEVIARPADLSGPAVLDLGGGGDLGIHQMAEFVGAAQARFADAPDTAFALAHFDSKLAPRLGVVRGYAADGGTLVMRRGRCTDGPADVRRWPYAMRLRLRVAARPNASPTSAIEPGSGAVPKVWLPKLLLMAVS
jgi:hypothetical protein